MRVLITGGLGAIGLLVAAWLINHNPESEIHLLGRSGQGSIGPMIGETLGRVVMQKCDISSKDDIGRLSSQFTHVIHAGRPLLCTLLNQMEYTWI